MPPFTDTDPSTIASPAGGEPPPGVPGSSGQDLSATPSLANRPGEGATPPMPSAGAPQPGPQPGLEARMRQLMGGALFLMDMAVRLGPSGPARSKIMKHAEALAKDFRMQDLGGGAPGMPMAPQGPPGMGGPPGLGAGPLAQPGTPNLPRGPIPGPAGGGMLTA